MSEPDASDLSRIYEEYHDRVFAYAAKLIGRDEAADVAQEVFVKAGRALGTLQDPSKLSSWLYAITLNTVRDAARRGAARPEGPSGSPGGAPEGGEAGRGLAILPDSASRTPEEVAIRNEMVACYLDFVNRLPPGYLEVYALSEFEHLSTEEMARRLSLSPGTVKIRLHRARAKLNEELRRHCRCYYNERGELMAEPKDP